MTVGPHSVQPSCISPPRSWKGEAIRDRKHASRHAVSAILTRAALFLCMLMLSIGTAGAQQKQAKSYDSQQLGKALEYFMAGKYSEALLIFEPLDATYSLNSRFRAYMGVCYYYVWNYEKACEYLDSVMPEMEVYAPHERSIYYHTAAESHFNLAQYAAAIPLYERQLAVCYDNEKGDAFYRMGFCYMLTNDWANAYDFFTSALLYYERYLNTPELHARITQIRNMLPGIRKRMGKNAIVYYHDPVAADTIYTDSIADTLTVTHGDTLFIPADTLLIDSVIVDVDEPFRQLK